MSSNLKDVETTILCCEYLLKRDPNDKWARAVLALKREERRKIRSKSMSKIKTMIVAAAAAFVAVLMPRGHGQGLVISNLFWHGATNEVATYEASNAFVEYFPGVPAEALSPALGIGATQVFGFSFFCETGKSYQVEATLIGPKFQAVYDWQAVSPLITGSNQVFNFRQGVAAERMGYRVKCQ